jgi:flagellin
MYLDTNLSALLTEQAWQTNATQLQTLNTELATGQADPSPADNPADTMMATQMGGQLGMLTAALQNTQTTVDGLNTVLGSYQAIGSVLDQLNQLAVQASSSTATTESPALSDQVTALLQQLTAMTQGVTVNGRSVFAPAFTETRMGSTAPQITAITLDHYDQAEMGGEIKVPASHWKT